MSVDKAQYEHLAAIYDSSLHIPVRRCDTANFLAAIEPISGRNVLDLATGTGYFARTMSRLGAGHVVGVDVSEGMLQAARHLSPEGSVRYVAGDVFSVLRLLGEEEEEEMFDLVTGVWCLNYAGNRGMMQTAWRNIARFLKPGGRFVGIVPGDFMQWLDEKEVFYGFSYERVEKVEEGWLLKKTLHAEQGPVSFKAYVLDEDVSRSAAEAAGMRDVRIEKPEVVPKFEGDEDEVFWQHFMKRPLFKVMTAVKA
ncbi:hypothetical protein N0V82_005583 [Gnomoniopsis sp. IMI 355080]|nr:hypothetical protein N0V82_005583 [Gnomoniopsis sp. IMI 355080]